MTREVDQLLTEGLAEGYAGGTSRNRVWRAGFQFKSSEHVVTDGKGGVSGAYIDEWRANRTGGGQEVARIGDTETTRLYAGGVIDLEALDTLGLKKEDVTGYLKGKIIELGDQTRLQEDCMPDPDGNWQYAYKVMQHLEEIPLTVGTETIDYRGSLVFAHGFLLSPIE